MIIILIKEIELIQWNNYINDISLDLSNNQIYSINGIQNLTKLSEL